MSFHIKDNKFDIKDALPDFYLPFSGYVLQTRAIPDSRDGLKQGARFIIFAQMKHKLVYNKDRRKAVATVNAGMEFSPHGDASVYGTAVRLSQPFSLRYPIIEVKGNNGSLFAGDDFSASRYVEMRSNKIADEMTNLLSKETIDKWKLNYTQEQEYPTVLPTRFPFSLVNGNTGIGVGCSSSIPQFNLREVSDALVKLLYNPEISFEEIYCPIDFATGGIIINEEEVKESLKNGNGKAACIRAKIEYDSDKNELSVRELPYQVFTSTVSKQIQAAIDENKLYGVESFFDGTGFEGINIRIKLTKGANPEKVCKLLYKETSLQHHYSINMMMLENGTTPRLFNWKEMMESYLSHLEDVIRKAYLFDLRKIQNRIHILEGYLKALANIEEVIQVIKTAADIENASRGLQQKFGFTAAQAKAILDLKLQRLANMEKIKIENELADISKKAEEITAILYSEELFKKEIEKEILRVKKEYGDARRTINMNLKFDGDDEEPVEKKTLIVHLTNFGNLYTFESTTLMTQRRGGKGTKVKMDSNEYIIDTISDSNASNCLIFSNKGKVYTINLNDLPINQKVNINTIFEFETGEQITNIIPFSKINNRNYMVFVTKNGMIKKSSLEEYRIKKSKGVIAVKIKDGDVLKRVMLVDSAPVGILTKAGNYLIIDTETINPTGRATSGVIGIKLSKDDEVVDAKIIPPNTKEIISISSSGMIKRTDYDSFSIGNRATKGSSIQKLKDNDTMISFNVIDEKDDEIAVVSNKAIIKISLKETQLSSKGAQGTQAKKMDARERITEVLKIKER